jgi:hypothetical protein
MPGHFHPGLPLLARIRQPPSTSFATHLLRVCCTSHATPRVQCPDGAEPNRSLRRVRPAPRLMAQSRIDRCAESVLLLGGALRQAVRASRPSTVPSSRAAMDPKVENEEYGRSPLAESAQLHSSRGDLTNTVRNRGFGVHSPSRDHGGEGHARTRVASLSTGAGRTPRHETLA